MRKTMISHNQTAKSLPPVMACSGIGIVHNMGVEGIPVYNGSVIRENPAQYSSYTRRRFRFSTYKDERFIEQLQQLGESMKQRPVLVSDDDSAILLISRHRRLLKDYYRFLLPEHSTVNSVLDKRKMARLSDTYQLPIPESYEVNSFEQLGEIINQIPYPCIIKPVYKNQWRDYQNFASVVGREYKKALRCDSKEELLDLYQRVARISPHIVIQEYVRGDDNRHYSLNMYLDEAGNMRGYFIANKRRTYPINAGQGCYIETVQEEEVLNKSLDIADKLDLVGLLNVQFKRDAVSGELKLMEIHFRNSAWSYIGTASNMNLYAAYYYDLIGKNDYELGPFKEGVVYVDLSRDLKAIYQYWKIGKLTLGEWLASYSRKVVFAGMLTSDLRSIVAQLWFMVEKRIRWLFGKSGSGASEFPDKERHQEKTSDHGYYRIEPNSSNGV